MCTKGQELKVGSFLALTIREDAAVNSGYYHCIGTSKCYSFSCSCF